MSENALAAMAAKKLNGSHRIKPGAEVRDGNLVLSFPLAELAKSRQGSGSRRSVGFSMVPITVELDEGIFQVSSAWFSITAR